MSEINEHHCRILKIYFRILACNNLGNNFKIKMY